MPKYPKSKSVESSYEGEFYVKLDGGTKAERAEAFSKFADAVNEYDGVQRSKATWDQDFSDLATNVSGRPGLSRTDYNKFRPQEAVPVKRKAIQSKANQMYQRVGLIRNTVDLMGDFACQGIRLVHPNKKIERFFRKWFAKVRGEERSERFLNLFYRQGTVVTRVRTARVKKRFEEQLFKVVGKPEMEIPTTPTPFKKEIPWRYVFLNPTTIDVAGGPLASFVGDSLYMVSLSYSLSQKIKNPSGAIERELVAKLPDEIKKAARKNEPVLLEPEKTRVAHYKKDDWQEWANPMIYAIMDDVILYEKMRLADAAALDGAISNIRIFKLGNLEHQIAPTRAAAAKLAEILESNVGGGTMDLVWGPDIEMID
jgi:hypothetical protein